MWFRLLTAVAICLATAAPCFALRQYRCNGRVQYRPCDTETEMEDGLTTASSGPVGRARWTPMHSGKGAEPRVFEDTFEIASEHEGIWRGQVAGDGLIELNLYIYRGGHLDTQRYIGAVELHGETTFFAFKSFLPGGDDWTWVIKARAT